MQLSVSPSEVRLLLLFFLRLRFFFLFLRTLLIKSSKLSSSSSPPTTICSPPSSPFPPTTGSIFLLLSPPTRPPGEFSQASCSLARLLFLLLSLPSPTTSPSGSHISLPFMRPSPPLSIFISGSASLIPSSTCSSTAGSPTAVPNTGCALLLPQERTDCFRYVETTESILVLALAFDSMLPHSGIFKGSLTIDFISVGVPILLARPPSLKLSHISLIFRCLLPSPTTTVFTISGLSRPAKLTTRGFLTKLSSSLALSPRSLSPPPREFKSD